jgi:S1-C subfamily serine protease
MEDLNNQQMILLTLLVSFVASIATSITIVSILTDTTPVVSQTINSIVERTIEKIVPSATSTTIFKTVPVPTPMQTPTENERLVAAIQKITPSMSVISKISSETGEKNVIGLGFAISGDYIATDKNMLGDGKGLSITLANGKTHQAIVAYAEEKNRAALLRVDLGNSTSTVTFRSAALSSEALKLGQDILLLGGKSGSTLSRGIISDLSNDSGGIDTTIAQKREDRGGPLFDMQGGIVGMSVLFPAGEYGFIPASFISEALNAMKKLSTEEETKPAGSAAAAAALSVPSSSVQ